MNSITGRALAIPAASVTNSGAASSRALHVELTSQQRRLRHLRSIAARNIVNKNGSPLLDTYFTLHLCVGDRISRDADFENRGPTLCSCIIAFCFRSHSSSRGNGAFTEWVFYFFFI
ncbi:hypothetical protein ATANTOWER_003778 [Ataeniobius toweri]|uniref:Uncharacterized protein n=1 Tax=Ataeniobius toweri TaxID=208326 RepID=A0ABU7BWL0_9TELE|nr:hypothetical protein [Ataeniobius toweri]